MASVLAALLFEETADRTLAPALRLGAVQVSCRLKLRSRLSDSKRAAEAASHLVGRPFLTPAPRDELPT